MLDILLFPFELVFGILGGVFGLLGDVLGFVFGLLGGIFSLVFKLSLVGLIIGLIVSFFRPKEKESVQEDSPSYYQGSVR